MLMMLKHAWQKAGDTSCFTKRVYHCVHCDMQHWARVSLQVCKHPRIGKRNAKAIFDNMLNVVIHRNAQFCGIHC